MRAFRFLVLAVAALLLALPIGVSAQDAGAKVRLVHVIPAVAGLDVYINGNLTASNLGYGQSTDYVDTPAADLTVRVTLAGVSSTLWEQVVPASANSALTLIASSTDPLTFDVFEDSLAEVSLATTRFMVIHAVNGAPNVDVIAEGQTIATGLPYRGFLNTIDVPVNTYTFTVVPEGGSSDAPFIPPTSAALAGRTSHMLVLYGPATAPSTLLLKAPVEVAGDVGFVRVSHGADGAPNVDVLFNGDLVVPGLAFGESSVHVPVEAGSYTATLRVAGGGSEITTADVEVVAGGAQTVAAVGSLDDLRVAAFTDTIDAVAPRSTVVSLINGIAGSMVSLTLEDGTSIASGLAFGEASAAVTLSPSRQALTMSVAVGEVAADINIPAIAFYGGTYVNLVAVREGSSFGLDVSSTGLAVAMNSAPGAADMLASVEPTALPTTVAVAQPTAAPQSAAPTAQSIVTAPTVPSLPTARVVLDPGANLQLREYPRADARSLGLAPSGTVFTVNGRVGAPIDILTGNVIPLPDGTDWVDPVALLTEQNQDLEPSDTWINVSLATADGEVNAWINALYVDLRNPRGERQQLRDLPTIPQNQPGSSTGTIVATPAPPENFARAVVFNLDPGVGLNIRRTAESSGEVLGRMELGQNARLVGIGQSGEWAFVEFEPAEGGTISGWAGMLYLRYEYRGRSVTLDEVRALNLLTEVDEATRRGSVTAGAPPLVQPTQDPLRGVNVATVVGLDAGVSLNLRRTPSVDAEVLTQVPLGAQVRVLSRSGSDAWLEVEFDGLVGWVASLYTTLSFNGRPISITDIPVNTTFNATATPTPTATPAP